MFLYPVSLAILSAIFLAIGVYIQSAVVKKTSPSNFNFRILISLITNKLWLTGLVILGISVLMNIAALSLAPLIIVQPFGVFALIVTTFIYVYKADLKLNFGLYKAVSCCIAGSVGFVLTVFKFSNNSYVSIQEVYRVLILLSIVIIIIFTILLFDNKFKKFTLILGAGILFGFVASFARIFSYTIAEIGFEQTMRSYYYLFLVIIFTAILGGMLAQKAYTCNSPDVVIAGITIIDPIVAITVGVVFFGETQTIPLVWIIVMLTFIGLGIGGIIGLSRYHKNFAL